MVHGVVQIWHCLSLWTALKNETIDVYNNGEMYRDFTYVEDLVKAIRLLSNKIPHASKNGDRYFQSF